MGTLHKVLAYLIEKMNVMNFSCSIVAADRPERPVITGVGSLTPESVLLQWVEPHHNNAPLLGFLVFTDGELVGNVTSDEDSLNVTGLMPGTEYEFTVVAFNSIGSSTSSVGVTVTTLEIGKTNVYRL